MNISRFNRAYIALVICVLPLVVMASTIVEGFNTYGVSIPKSGSAALLGSNDQFIDIEWKWSEFHAKTVQTPQGEFHKLSLGVELPASRQALGEPELPIDVEIIRYPSGTIGKVEVLSAEWVVYNDARPYPVQFPARDGEETPPFAFDADAYTSNLTIPEEIAGVTTPKGWGGLEVGSLWVSPFRYTASQKRLEVATSIKVRVWFEYDGRFEVTSSNSPSPWLIQAQRSLLLNPPLDPPQLDDADEPEPIRLLVVARHQEALDIAQPLIEIHQNFGLKSTTWMIDGEVEPVDIKDRIRELYELGLQYVLLIGDGDSLTPDIPMYYWEGDYPGADLGEPDACGSDSWFTCMDPEDRDGYEDHLPDLAIGRLVYDNINALNQLQVQVDKLTDYIPWQFNDQNSEWLRRGLMIAHIQNDEGHDYIPCKNTIVTADYDFPHPEWIFLPGDAEECTDERIIELMNEGVGIVNYRGHGDETMWWRYNDARDNFTSADIAQLTNRQKPFLIISSACLNGNIYDYRGTCLAESFQKHNNGGSLCINACTMSTITMGNSYADIAIFNALYNQGIFNIGYANNAATVSSVLYFDANAPNNWRGIGYLNMRAYIWLGDAAVDYRLADPVALSLAAPQLIPEGARQLELNVSSDGEPYENAAIVVRTTDNAVYSIGSSDAEGNALIVFEEPVEVQQGLIITASNREAKPATALAIVANGLGIIDGHVLRNSDDQPIADATVDLLEYHVVAITDQNGAFHMEGIPSGEYRITASIPGMVPMTRQIDVVENLVSQVDFNLTQSRMNLAVERVEEVLYADSTSQSSLSYSNEGDANLEWTAEFVPDVRHDPFDQVMEFFPGWDNGDSRIYGAVFIDNKFYVAGGNNNIDPNYIYVYNREGAEIPDLRIEQQTIGNGFRDLEWDGEFLYGAGNSEIQLLSLDGEIISRINGPHDPCRAIAVDPDGNIWVGNNRSAIVKIDRQGRTLQNIAVNFYVMGLTWYSDQSDGNNLLILGRPAATGVELYGANPETGRITFFQNLAGAENETAVEGLFVTHDYDSRDWTLIATVSNNETEAVRLLQLDPRSDWIEIDPLSGSLEPNLESEISLTLNAIDYDPGTILSGNALFTTNNIEEVIALPIQLSINPNSVLHESLADLPTNLELSRIYPNPFNAKLKIDVALPSPGELSVGIYDLQGRLVSQQRFSGFDAGNHSISINGGGLANGLYIIRAESNGRIATAKATLLK